MRSELETATPDTAVILRGLVYALAIALLIVFGPSEPHVFIYQGF